MPTVKIETWGVWDGEVHNPHLISIPNLWGTNSSKAEVMQQADDLNRLFTTNRYLPTPITMTVELPEGAEVKE